jgi:hypothetical protein
VDRAAGVAVPPFDKIVGTAGVTVNKGEGEIDGEIAAAGDTSTSTLALMAKRATRITPKAALTRIE